MIKDEYKCYTSVYYNNDYNITYYEPVQDIKMRNRLSCFFLNGIIFTYLWEQVNEDDQNFARVASLRFYQVGNSLVIHSIFYKHSFSQVFCLSAWINLYLHSYWLFVIQTFYWNIYIPYRKTQLIQVDEL